MILSNFTHFLYRKVYIQFFSNHRITWELEPLCIGLKVEHSSVAIVGREQKI